MTLLLVKILNAQNVVGILRYMTQCSQKPGNAWIVTTKIMIGEF